MRNLGVDASQRVSTRAGAFTTFIFFPVFLRFLLYSLPTVRRIGKAFLQRTFVRIIYTAEVRSFELVSILISNYRKLIGKCWNNRRSFRCSRNETELKHVHRTREWNGSRWWKERLTIIRTDYGRWCVCRKLKNGRTHVRWTIYHRQTCRKYTYRLCGLHIVCKNLTKYSKYSTRWQYKISITLLVLTGIKICINIHSLNMKRACLSIDTIEQFN